MYAPLYNWSLVLDPGFRAFFVGIDGASAEATGVLLQHLYLQIIGCIFLQEQKYSCYYYKTKDPEKEKI